MESWRTWTGLGGKFGIKRDYRSPLEVPDEEAGTSLGPPALMVREQNLFGKKGVRLVLYRAMRNGRMPVLMGMITATQTKKPCITNSDGPTYSVNFSAVDEEYRGKGYGSMMYGLLMSWCEKRGIGLTSDKVSGTSKSAAKTWNKLGSTMGIEKKVTAAGNDTFDTTGNETPDDPDDDCDKGYTNDVKHSFMDQTGNYDSPRRRFNRQHKKNVEKNSGLERKLLRMAKALFKRAYRET